MAKKRVPSSSKGKATTPRSSSTVNTNSFVKGMNKDIAPSMENNQAWWHARNIANNSEDGDVGLIGNEPSNLQCGVIPYTVIGAIHKYGDEWVVYSTDDINSEIGTFDDSECKYTTLVNDRCLSFNRKFLITGAAKENFDCTWEVYWDDGNNPSRALNIDDIPYKQYISSADGDPCIVYSNIEPKRLDCEKIRLAPLVDTPCIELTKATDGGMLQNGAYQAFVAYTENEQRVTDYIGISNIQTLWSHKGTSSSLDIDISNLDEKYFNFELVLLRRNQGQTSAKKIGLYSTQIQSINIDYIDESLTAVDLTTIPMRSPAYEKSESMFVVNDWLLRQGPTEQFDFNYQPIANNITTKWVSSSVSSAYYKLAGNKLGFMRDEQYAFFIRWIYNTGERSSSYHIPGRASQLYVLPNGTSSLESDIIFGGASSNVLNPEGEKLFKVYNTGTITEPNINTVEPDGSFLNAKGDMGYWESSEKYPSNRPDIWGDLCGQYIRHHKFPDETLGGANSPLHISNTNGDLINLLGVEFSNIGRPTYNDGSYIENVVGYEILRGSRQGARSILAKGMFKNMRKYDIPNEENILGANTQGLYPNYPYNSLQDDVYFHDGKKTEDHITSGCENSFTANIGKYKPLKGYTEDVFTFHSPDLMFTKPFLNAYETKIYGDISGNSTGTFIPSEDHPQFKLLRPAAATLGCIIGVGYALNAVQGTTSKTAKAVQSDNSGGNAVFFGVSNSIGKAVENSVGIGSLTIGNAIWDVLLDDLIDTAVDIADLYGGGIVSSTQLNIAGTTNFLKGAIPGVKGGGIDEQVTWDKPEGAMPVMLRTLVGISLAQKNIAIGGNEVIDLMYNLASFTDFVLKYNSSGFYNSFTARPLTSIFRTKNLDSNYLGSSFQTFDGTKYKINNLFRPSTVAVSTESILGSPIVKDNSRFTLGGYVNTPSNTPEGGGTVVDYLNRYLINYSVPFKTSISSFYGSLKFNMDNQYGQLDGIKQVQMRGCVELLDDTQPNEFLYTTKPIYSGDVFINKYTEKCIMPIFSNFLKGQPDGFSYDYSLYVNVPFPRFWLDSTKYDISEAAAEVATLGFKPGSWQDALPSDKYFLDRGVGTCQSASIIGNLFGVGDINPAYTMKYAYMYSHVNGINEFFVESELNLAYRDWEDMPSKRFYDVYEYNDVASLFHADNIKADNFYKYDDSLSPIKFPTQLGSFGNIQPRDYDPYVSENCFVSYPKRLIYSLQAQEESKKDYWKVFLNFNYKDFKSEVSVIKPVNKSGAIIFFPYLSPQMFQGVDTLKTQLDTKLTIGDGGLFSQPFQNIANADISNEYGSCESLRGVINTPMGLFYISQAQGKIFQYAGKGLDPISNKGMKWWFNKYLPSRFIKQFPNSEESVWTDNPVNGVGCQVIYDSVDDIVYFMKKDYQLKSKYISGATFTNSLSKPVVITLQTGAFRIDIGDPLYFDDCSWTVSYDPKSNAWLSFHDWHPELALPSINHFFTTKTLTTTIPQCPPGYNYNPVNGLCEIGVNTTEPATITIDEVNSTVTGGTVDCVLDVVISMDASGSTNQGGRKEAQLAWLQSFINNDDILDQLNRGVLQLGFTQWGNTQIAYDIPLPSAPGTTYTMSNSFNKEAVIKWYNDNWLSSNSTELQLGFTSGQTRLNQKAGSKLGDRSGSAFFKQIIIYITDATQNDDSNGCAFQSGTTNSTGSNSKQNVFTLFCGAASAFPPDSSSSGFSNLMNSLSCDTGPVNGSQYQYGINANAASSTWDVVADSIASNICSIPFVCTCPTGYTKVFQNTTTGDFTEADGVCSNSPSPVCRKISCVCPTAPTGTNTTVTGTCPTVYEVGNPEYINPDPRMCNSFSYASTLPNYNVGGFWRHNVRCDSFVNYYGKSYPWEIDLISNTGQSVNTVRSFEYQLESYVYKGDPQYNMCGGDKWEDPNANFDSAIVYNNDQTSGLLVLNMQPDNDPWGELTYPIIGTNNINILVSKVEHKFRFNQFWDITNNRGESPLPSGITVEQSIFNTDCNGYIRPLNTINLNYQKDPTQRKKFRHYSNQLILRKNISGNRKMLLRLNNTKLQLSMR